MGMKKFRPITPSLRAYSVEDFSEVSSKKPEKGLLVKLAKTGGRNNLGRMTNINRGGGHKRRLRLVDFKRSKDGIPARVAAIEYDPNRSSRLALLVYSDGEKRYIIAASGLRVGDSVMSGPTAEVAVGNSLPLRNMPIGQVIHGVELKIGGGAQLARSAGAVVQLVAKENGYALIRLPSGETRRVLLDCRATVGSVGNPEHSNLIIGKAGRSRWLGVRPHNRGVTKNPVDHPMGGGEGKTSGGRHPCSASAVPAKGFKTRKNKRTAKFIVRGRK
jgi:large subunit ribosomal protein L2